MVAMLGLTIRTAWNQKPKLTIPKGPCFHDDGHEDDDVEEGHDNNGFENVPEAVVAQANHEDENIEEEILGANTLPMSNVIWVKPFREEFDQNNQAIESPEIPQNHLEKTDEDENNLSEAFKYEKEPENSAFKMESHKDVF